ncbi:FecR family protein [Marispirochaeta sp.]|uniref:FecR family protein n=1 Tax=Marispirochaeta sp. TaxID=2038653 RepID=UPI0029C8F03A|nr:FecR family protein [Marispirochaeta sp.]
MNLSSPAHKLFLTAAGLLLGIILYLFYFVGGFLTLAGFLVERATQPLPQAGILQETGSMQQEILSFLEELQLGQITMIEEAPLGRLVSAMTQQLPYSGNQDQGIDIRGINLDLEPEGISAAADLVITLPAYSSIRGIRLKPVSTSVRADFQVLQDDDGLLISLTGIRLSQLALPRRIAESIFAGLIPEDADLPFTRVSRSTVALPYSLLQEALPPELRLGRIARIVSIESLEARKDALAADLRIDPELQKTVLAELSALFGREGAGFAAAVAAAFPAGEEELKASALRLSALGSPESLIPGEPTALVSHISRQVTARDRNGRIFIPARGSDIHQDTSIQTGKGSFIELILRDDSMLKIGEDTNLVLAELPAGTEQAAGRFNLIAGAVRGHIADSRSTDYLFTTPSAEYRVTGTDLVLEVEPRETRLSVLEGSVLCEPEKRPESAVRANQQLAAKPRELTRRHTRALPPGALTEVEKKRLEGLMNLFSAPKDAAEIRETTRFWVSLNEFKNVTSRIISLDEESRARLGDELEKRVDPEAVDRSFKALMQNPDFAAIIDSYGIEGIPYP